MIPPQIIDFELDCESYVHGQPVSAKLIFSPIQTGSHEEWSWGATDRQGRGGTLTVSFTVPGQKPRQVTLTGYDGVPWPCVSEDLVTAIFSGRAWKRDTLIAMVTDGDTGKYVTSTAELKVRFARYIGAHVGSEETPESARVDFFLEQQRSRLGPMRFTRIAYRDDEPATAMVTWNNGHRSWDNESKLPEDVVPMICVQPQHIPRLPAYAASIPRGRKVIIVFRENPEHIYRTYSGQQFLTEFAQASSAIRSAGNPDIKIASCNSAHAYSKAAFGLSGPYIIPSGMDHLVDLRLINIYQKSGSWTAGGLRTSDQWLNWLELVPKTKPLGIASYGISDDRGEDVRKERMEEDAAYLHETFTPGGIVSPYPLECFGYDWIRKGLADNYQFTDDQTLSLFRDLVTGEK